MLWCFLAGLNNVRSSEGDMRRLEQALRRAAVACYAVEGVYPANLAQLQERCGVQIDRKRYAVDYVFIADNLMPDITVLETW